MSAAASIVLLAAALAALNGSCEFFRHPEPLPPSKQQFVGVWRSSAGFVLRIKAAGTAVIAQIPDPADPQAAALNIKVAAPVINDLLVEFRGDTAMLVVTPLLYAREYHIDRPPFDDGDTVKMILNGVTLLRR
jgi:hypothetical protein